MKRTARVVVADDDGTSRFEEKEIEFFSIEDAVPGGRFDAASLGASDVALVQFEPGFAASFHPTPAPTWMFVLTGRMALGLSNDVWAELVPGDLIYMTDCTGEGHQSRVIGDEPVLMATAGYGG